MDLISRKILLLGLQEPVEARLRSYYDRSGADSLDLDSHSLERIEENSISSEPYSLAYFQTNSKDLSQISMILEWLHGVPLVVLSEDWQESSREDILNRGALDTLSLDELGEEHLSKIDHFSKIQSRLHQELKNSQAALEQSLQEQQDFAYIASHDLQEPLRMVSSYLGLLKARCDRKLDDSERDFIDFAVDGAQRMKMMIQDILDLSRITTRGKEFEQEDLKHLAEKAKTSVLLTCDCKDPRIHWKDLPTLWVDRAQIQRIFTVLFANALTYCKESQAIIEVGASCQNGEWTISVQDNGIGIEERFYSRIFLLFQRLHTQEEYEGRGVGLAIVKKIIERHAGRIWVESAIGEGSTFYFTLPDRI